MKKASCRPNNQPRKTCVICGEDIMKNYGYHTNTCHKCTIL